MINPTPIHPRRSMPWLLLPLLASTLACRLEISANQPYAAAGGVSVPAVLPPAVVAPLPPTAVPPLQTAVLPSPVTTAPAPLPPVPTVIPSPLPTVTPIPSATAVIPAQSSPTRIVVPAIGLDGPVEPMGWQVVSQNDQDNSVWAVPDNAAGWHQNSALPGHAGNVVLSGHHNLGTEIFRRVVELRPGDEITLQADGRDYVYIVSDRFIVPDRDVSEEQQQQNARWIMPTTTERLTLVTCWPYTSNTHRVIVIARPKG